MLSAVAKLERRVLAVVAGKFTVREQRLTPGTHIKQDLGADSLALMELVMLLESEFQVDIPDEELDRIGTVQQVIDYLRDESQALHS